MHPFQTVEGIASSFLLKLLVLLLRHLAFIGQASSLSPLWWSTHWALWLLDPGEAQRNGEPGRNLDLTLVWWPEPQPGGRIDSALVWVVCMGATSSSFSGLPSWLRPGQTVAVWVLTRP